MTDHVINHLWQSTVFAAAIAMFTLLFRHSRAQVRYWLWFSASLKFLFPFALLIALGRQVEWAPSVRDATPVTVSTTVAQLSEPFISNAADTPPEKPDTSSWDWWLKWISLVWLAGCFTVTARRLRAWQRVRAAVNAGSRLDLSDVKLPTGVEMRSTPGLFEPGVVGWVRPVLLLPAGLESQLTRTQLKAIIAHETAHIRRRDNITAAIHMFVESLFWFHPLVWWIGARLVDERERACDEEVLQMFEEPEAYAEGILIVCKRYVEAPLACVSGVSGSNIKQRLEAIMNNRIGIQLSRTGKLLLVVSATFAVAVPLAVGAMTVPRRAQSAATQKTQSDKKFVEASIRRCTEETEAPAGQRGGGSNSLRLTPGRAYAQCLTVATLVRTAYEYPPAQLDLLNTTDEGPLREPRPPMRSELVAGLGVEDGIRVRGGPDWVRSEKYTIEAIGDESATFEEMIGPMLRELLERRLQLKAHIESEPVEAFSLTVGPGGFKIQPVPDGACTREPLTDEVKKKRNGRNGPVMLTEAARLGIKPTCGAILGGPNGPNVHTELVGQPNLNSVAFTAAFAMDVRVINRTNVAGPFSFAWDFAPDESTPGSQRRMQQTGAPRPGWDGPADQPKAPPLSVALAQLGLKLEPIKVPREFIVIDRIARPSPN